MTETTTPFDALIQMQRDTIKQSQGLFEQGLELQQNAIESFMQNGISAQRAAQRQGTDFLQNLFNAQYDAVESALDDDEVRAALDRQFEHNAELVRELITAQVDQSTELGHKLFNAQADAVESAMRDEEFRAAFNDQFEEFESTQQRAWDEFESEFGETFAELSDRQKALVAETVETTLTAQRETADDTAEPVRASEAAPVDITEADEAVAETTTEQLSKDVRTTEDGAQSDDARLEDIEGVTQTDADQLRGNGIQSVGALAEADTETVAEAAEVSEDHAHEWVTSAQTQA